jgi:hypothetical protein
VPRQRHVQQEQIINHFAVLTGLNGGAQTLELVADAPPQGALHCRQGRHEEEKFGRAPKLLVGLCLGCQPDHTLRQFLAPVDAAGWIGALAARRVSGCAKAELADHHVRREAILIRRGEVKDAPLGGRPKNLDNLSKYSARAAADLGVDERTVRRDLRRGKNISAEVLAEVTGTVELIQCVFVANIRSIFQEP